jgi:hypothetical protein
MATKTGLDALLTPERSALLLIDHQAFQFANWHSHETDADHQQRGRASEGGEGVQSSYDTDRCHRGAGWASPQG